MTCSVILNVTKKKKVKLVENFCKKKNSVLPQQRQKTPKKLFLSPKHAINKN